MSSALIGDSRPKIVTSRYSNEIRDACGFDAQAVVNYLNNLIPENSVPIELGKPEHISHKHGYFLRKAIGESPIVCDRVIPLKRIRLGVFGSLFSGVGEVCYKKRRESEFWGEAFESITLRLKRLELREGHFPGLEVYFYKEAERMEGLKGAVADRKDFTVIDGSWERANLEYLISSRAFYPNN